MLLFVDEAETWVDKLIKAIKNHHKNCEWVLFYLSEVSGEWQKLVDKVELDS